MSGVANKTDLLELLQDSCSKHGRRLALRYKKQKIKYSVLNKRASCLSLGLRFNLAINPGDKAALLLDNSPEYIISLFAVLKARATAIPINTFLKKEEIDYILSDSQAKILITSTSFWNKIKPLDNNHDSFANCPEPLVLLVDQRIEGCQFIDDILLKESRTNLGIKVAPHCVRDNSSGNPERSERVDTNSPAVIIYTSGTTGRPKGAVLSLKNLASNVTACMKTIEVGTKDRVLLILPMFHTFTITVCIFLPLVAGAGIIILPSLKPFHQVIRNIVFSRVSIIVGIPQLYRIFSELNLPRFLSKFLAIRLCVSGAAALDEKTYYLFTRKFKIPLLEGYGLSEASPVVSMNPLKGIQKVGSVGLPLPGIEVKVVDDNEGELPLGKIGELIVRGPNIMQGYYNLPEQSAAALKNNWLFTGDMARIDEDGYIYIVDRKKDMIISHGMNIYPAEIEQVIMQHPKVKETAVIGRPDKHRGEIPVCFVVPREGEELTQKEIIALCKEKLANYKVPHQVEFREEFPHTPTGKILKRKLI